MFKEVRRARTEDGFTLIELLIVIIILGILAAIVVFAIGNTRKDSVANSCKTDAKAIQLSLEAQNTTGGTYAHAGTDAAPTEYTTTVPPTNALQSTSVPKGALLKTWPGDQTPVGNAAGQAAIGSATGDYRFIYTSTVDANGVRHYSVQVDGKSVKGANSSLAAPAPQFGFSDTVDNVSTACTGV